MARSFTQLKITMFYRPVRSALALFFFALALAVCCIWYTGASISGTRQIAISYGLVTVLGLSGIWLLFEAILEGFEKYQELPEEDKKVLQSMIDNFHDMLVEDK